MKTFEVSLTEFREFLEKKSPEQVIGKKRNCLMCPLAVFIAIKTQRAVRVDYEAVWIGEEVYRLPDWAIAFIDKVDRNYEASRYVNVEDCLLALSKQTVN